MENATPVWQTPYERGGVIAPGLPVLSPGVERHPVAGGGSLLLRIGRGDEIGVVDCEGMQPVEVVFFSPDGKSDAAMFGAVGGCTAAGGRTASGGCTASGGGDFAAMQNALSATDSGARLLRKLEKAGAEFAAADVARLFADGSRPGDLEIFHAAEDGLLLVWAVGGMMSPDAQNTPTDVVLYVRRANANSRLEAAEGAPPLAPPQAALAEPLADINIQPGEAKAYEVRAGQYVQILDVRGRECSDFQAMSLRGIERGTASDIDPTTTRSLTGTLYPTPGVYSKYYSMAQEPLVQIVGDTCGRHDAFNLACTARYYEDLGYPGHANCSDNINAEMAHYDVAPRAGWPAINFFFNTTLSAPHVIGMDEPWSRPGDYVLLRALTDLVCVSTACPCDVDAANGWNPTDIQVRVYDEKEKFQHFTGRRKTPEADMEKTKQTGFHACFARHTRDFVEYNGYWLPNTMTRYGAVAEYWACREKAAVMDLSPLRKVEITGPDAEKLLQWCVPRDIKKLATGQVVYTAVCYPHGGMIDDGTIFRLGENNFRWVGGNDESGLWMRRQAEERGLDAWVRNSTAQLCNIALQGRLSLDILNKVMWTPPTQPTLDELGWFRFTVARLGDFHGPACVVSRTGYSGELGVEVFCHPKDAEAIFDALWQAGEPLGLAPLGLAALDMLRIEAGLIFAGAEFSDQTNPLEAGIGFTVPLKSKTDDFVGREALMERSAHPQRTLVGLDIEGGTVPASGDCVRVGRAQAGEITSAVKSPILGGVIALARLDVTYAKPGTAVEVGQLDGQQKRLRATVVKFPHFDPEKSRVKGNYAA